MQVAPSPPAIARRPVAHLAAPLVCRPVFLASQDMTPGDEGGSSWDGLSRCETHHLAGTNLMGFALLWPSYGLDPGIHLRRSGRAKARPFFLSRY